MKTAKVLGMLFPLLGLAVSTPASALSWDTATSGIGLLSAGASIYCGSGGNTCNTTGTSLSGTVMKMTAYSTPTFASWGTSPTDSGTWVDAKLAIYSGGGVGITNTVNTSDPNYPQHGVDNYGVTDILVIDFQSNNWDVSAFSLGWACSMSSSTTCSGTTSVNVDAWVGGNASTTVSGMTFSGTTLTSNTGNFTALNLSPDPSGTGVRTETPATAALGRYLVITGSLAGYTDAFKISGVTASLGTPPPTGVPLPGTVPLFALGLLALGFAARRRPVLLRAAG